VQLSTVWGQLKLLTALMPPLRGIIMEALLPLLIQLGSGAIGGNVAGKVMPENSLGTLGNTIAGIAGGGIGGTLLSSVLGAAASGGGMGLGSIISQVAGGGVGGGALMIVIGIVRKMMSK
jgi:hypothetical protein